MDGKMIPKDRLLDFLDRIREKKSLIAPVDVDGVVLFKQVTDKEKVLLEYENAVLPPKDWFFGQSRELFAFESAMKNLTITMSEKDPGEYVLFGVRPCDLKSIALLDRVFLGEVSGEPFTDDDYQWRRKQTTLIGLSCKEPEDSCFCFSFGLSPMSSEHADLMLTELEDGYYVDVVTKKGEAIVEEFQSFFEEVEEIEENNKKALEESQKEKMMEVDTSEVFDRIASSYDSLYWDEIANRCIGCGICTYLCPTCHCFDIHDESAGEKGRRMRTWDSCMFSNFTLMTSGENPRATQKERVRQRFFHKLRYYQERYGESLCVGCGRCIAKCPVNIDIAQIIQDVKELA